MKSIFYNSGYKYQLASPFSVLTDIWPLEAISIEFVKMDTDGTLHILPGYAWDGATGVIDSREIMRASLVHDALYQLMRGNYLDRHAWRERADNLLRSLCLEDGMLHAFAELAYQGVRLLGNPRADPESAHPILQAPRDE